MTEAGSMAIGDRWCEERQRRKNKGDGRESYDEREESERSECDWDGELFAGELGEASEGDQGHDIGRQVPNDLRKHR